MQEQSNKGLEACRAELVQSLEKKEWGDVRSLLDEYVTTPTESVTSLLREYGTREVEFHWNKDDGWYYTDRVEEVA